MRSAKQLEDKSYFSLGKCVSSQMTQINADDISVKDQDCIRKVVCTSEGGITCLKKNFEKNADPIFCCVVILRLIRLILL